MKKVALMSLVTASILMAGGYKIPEASTNAVALCAANIAHNHENADAAYYNPAKMVFMKDTNNIEADLMYIGLSKIKYQGTVAGAGPYSLESDYENFIVPSLHYVSPKLGDNGARIGVSIVAPGALSKKYKTQPAKTFAEEFTLKILEINPTVAFEVTDSLGFAVGFRVLKTHGVVKSTGAVSRDMTGDSTDVGYNLALEYQPTSALELGLTYRSKVDLSAKGNARLYSGTTLAYNGDVSVTLPLPATLSVAAAYTFSSKTTIEAVYEKTYWSAYKNLDFNYTVSIGGLAPYFDNPKEKNWHDTNTFRFGLTQGFDTLTLMAGLVIDESPAPEKTLGFELPDTDTTSVSLGGRYKINKDLEIGLSALYSIHKNRTVHNSSLNGEFTDGDIVIVSAGLGYKF